MLSLRAINSVLRHFDSIDRAVAKRLIRKRPWPETALTALLCDLLDDETSDDEQISYSRADMMRDMAAFDEPLGFSLRIDTHQYSSHLERYVTQADIGLIIEYQNQFSPDKSFRRPWLLQAKRAFPSRRTASQYDHTSAFESADAAQLERMRLLEQWAHCPFVRFLYYCPRPADLSSETRERLSYLRNEALSTNIFDYALGLQLRDDLLSSSSTVAAGLFVGALDSPAKNIGEVHSRIFSASTPFSWFIVEHFSERSKGSRHLRPDDRPSSTTTPNHDELEQLVRGDALVLERGALSEVLSDHSLRVLPAHTVTISITHGIDRPNNHKGEQ
jgi:hypothetical protein